MLHLSAGFQNPNAPGYQANCRSPYTIRHDVAVSMASQYSKPVYDLYTSTLIPCASKAAPVLAGVRRDIVGATSLRAVLINVPFGEGNTHTSETLPSSAIAAPEYKERASGVVKDGRRVTFDSLQQLGHN